MNNILRDEVNQHTTGEVERVLTALEDGLAREETAQEILVQLEKAQNTPTLFLGGGTTPASTTTEVLNITGSGNLKWLGYNCSTTYRSTNKLVVTVDGEVIVNLSLYSGTSGSAPSLMVLICGSELLMGGSSSVYLLGSTGIKTFDTSGSVVREFSSSEISCEKGASRSLYVISSEGLKFKSSLKVTAITGASYSGTAVIGYALDE